MVSVDDGFVAKLVGLAVVGSCVDTASSHPVREALGVGTPPVRIVLDAGGCEVPVYEMKQLAVHPSNAANTQRRQCKSGR